MSGVYVVAQAYVRAAVAYSAAAQPQAVAYNAVARQRAVVAAAYNAAARQRAVQRTQAHERVVA